MLLFHGKHQDNTAFTKRTIYSITIKNKNKKHCQSAAFWSLHCICCMNCGEIKKNLKTMFYHNVLFFVFFFTKSPQKPPNIR